MRKLSSASTTPFRSNLPSSSPEKASPLDPVPRQRPSTLDLQATRESPLTWTLPREPILLEAFGVPRLLAHHRKALSHSSVAADALTSPNGPKLKQELNIPLAFVTHDITALSEGLLPDILNQNN
ncbi:MAG: hypothetical protein C5B47_04675 [Verrucomicrobia bacterium]|nr:MAG: hypothetical protein C5B47_04675 [Verrucomicrobiota bacterium]